MFSVGNYRRQIIGVEVTNDFFSPGNAMHSHCSTECSFSLSTSSHEYQIFLCFVFDAVSHNHNHNQNHPIQQKNNNNARTRTVDSHYINLLSYLPLCLSFPPVLVYPLFLSLMSIALFMLGWLFFLFLCRGLYIQILSPSLCLCLVAHGQR